MNSLIKNLSKIRIFKLNEGSALKILVIWILILSILYSLLAVLRHNHFQSGAYDLGIFDQSVWQYSNFQYPYNTIKERFILGDHFTVTLPLLAPLFYLWDDVRALLIFQAFFITFSALGVYKIARIRSLPSFSSLVIGIVYSLFYGIQTAVSFDFHPIVVAVGLLVWVAYFYESKKWRLFWPFLILLLLTQENTGIALAGLGLIYIFKKASWKAGLAFILGGIAVSLVEVRIVSLLSPVGYQYVPVISNNPLEILYSYFNAPEKLDNWKFSLVPLSFLPLLSPGAMLAVFLDLSQYYITGEVLSRMWTPYQHHRAILAPFMILGMIDAFLFLKRRKVNVNLLAVYILSVTLVSQYYFHFPLNKIIKADYWRTESWMKDNYRIIHSIPKGESVAASQNLVPHISHRNEVYLVWPRQARKNHNCNKENCWWLEFSGKPNLLFVDTRPHQWITQILESNENFQNALRNMEDDGKIKLLKSSGDAKLYKVIY